MRFHEASTSDAVESCVDVTSISYALLPRQHRGRATPGSLVTWTVRLARSYRFRGLVCFSASSTRWPSSAMPCVTRMPVTFAGVPFSSSAKFAAHARPSS